LAFFVYRNYMFCVYIIYSEKLNRFYIGTSDNYLKRLDEHNDIKYKDAFTVKGIPWELFFVINCNSSTQAYQIEKHIKKMKSVNYIRNFLMYPEIAYKLLEKFK
jgi:putative endonuclease